MRDRDALWDLEHTSSHDGPSVTPTSFKTHLNQLSGDLPLLGKPTTKKRIYYLGLGTAVLFSICLALGILVVSHESISWYLGVGNNQLVVVGLLLSIMSLCLGSVTPTLFVLLEARFGEFTFWNYDGLRRIKPTASRLGISCGVTLILMLALPIALSVAYKTFTGGESQMEIDGFDYISNKTHYGMFQPPNILLFNDVSGLFSATTGFREATKLSSNSSKSDFSNATGRI
ncbi:hypothetical protein CaCOL14_003643 [Colletotrichum acutatum]|uniref:Uncharacterized protein n=1 Tax=Glomerella acutata TaxID=27357 RepID=A0AAD8XQ67_GLOAC|nr:uncharacterized protein BDZ83DRAFT_646014 [Colletotrichum acutatum]KAK1731509.1 hypothetical protein BDZ83DRAFT_646014 [Colletotrichum acutatum]